jgi:hypothetical protein
MEESECQSMEVAGSDLAPRALSLLRADYGPHGPAFIRHNSAVESAAPAPKLHRSNSCPSLNDPAVPDGPSTLAAAAVKLSDGAAPMREDGDPALSMAVDKRVFRWRQPHVPNALDPSARDRSGSAHSEPPPSLLA